MSRVLVVDDEPGLRKSLRLLLADAGYDVADAPDASAALDRATTEHFDLVLCDVRMAGTDGLDFLRRYREAGGTALVIMMSAYGSEEAALRAMQDGAYDYIHKPFRADEVIFTLRKAEEREHLRHDVARLRAQMDLTPEGRAMIVESPAMRAALDMVARVADHPTTVLLTGESGTGKDVIAQAIHRASPRAGEPFVPINCAAIPAPLLESELFGHVRGAFTGASGGKAGLFEQADRGTLFLDEIGEFPVELQAKLLRVLQDGEIRRVGDQKAERVDVRVIAATARDLESAVAAGTFRQDLLFRLNVVNIHLPPLRDRQADIAPLTRHFVTRLARRMGRALTISAAALEWLEAQDWPGNVRELEHALERAAVLTEATVLEPSHFASGTDKRPPAVPAPGGTLNDAVQAAERASISAALATAGGNRREAAKRLGVSLRTLFYKLRQHGLD